MDKVKYIITQNIDGLHLRSGVPRTRISELHGNMFADQCDKCKKMVVRDSPAPTVGQKYSGQDCPAYRQDGRKCRGKMRDFVLDWEDNLPDDDLTISDTHAMMADLSIVMGSTLQIIPAGNMPTYTKKYHSNGKLVICNLQPTKHAKRADLNIHTYVDDIMTMLMGKLDLKIPEYNPDTDPVKLTRINQLPEQGFIDWTQCPTLAKSLKKLGDQIHDDFLKMKREEKKRKSLDYARQNKLRKREENESIDDCIQEDIEEGGDKATVKVEVKEENAAKIEDNTLHLEVPPQNTSSKADTTKQVQNVKPEEIPTIEVCAEDIDLKKDTYVTTTNSQVVENDTDNGIIKKDIPNGVNENDSMMIIDKFEKVNDNNAIIEDDTNVAVTDNKYIVNDFPDSISGIDESRDVGKPKVKDVIKNTAKVNGNTAEIEKGKESTEVSSKASYTLSTSEKALYSPLSGL